MTHPLGIEQSQPGTCPADEEATDFVAVNRNRFDRCLYEIAELLGESNAGTRVLEQGMVSSGGRAAMRSVAAIC